MSYDVHLEADLGCGPVRVGDLDSNMTWNIAPIVVAACGTSPSQWDGLTGAEVCALARKVADAIDAEPNKYRALNPPNGWGSAETCQRWMRGIAWACAGAPNATFRVH